jgi:hypothetical protein
VAADAFPRLRAVGPVPCAGGPARQGDDPGRHQPRGERRAQALRYATPHPPFPGMLAASPLKKRRWARPDHHLPRSRRRDWGALAGQVRDDHQPGGRAKRPLHAHDDCHSRPPDLNRRDLPRVQAPLPPRVQERALCLLRLLLVHRGRQAALPGPHQLAQLRPRPQLAGLRGLHGPILGDGACLHSAHHLGCATSLRPACGALCALLDQFLVVQGRFWAWLQAPP